MDLDIMRAATDRLFEHRRLLRDKAVRIGFWPDGLRIACGPSLKVIGWADIIGMTRDQMISTVDEVCGAIPWRS